MGNNPIEAFTGDDRGYALSSEITFLQSLPCIFEITQLPKKTFLQDVSC